MRATGIRTSWARLLAAVVLGMSVSAGCSLATGGAADGGAAQVFHTPAADAGGVSPTAPASVRVEQGSLEHVVLTDGAGVVVPGALSPDRTSYTVAGPLSYGARYSWSGLAVGDDGESVPVTGGFTTVAPRTTTSVTADIADGQVVGIAAPIVLRFGAPVADRAAVERALTVVTDPPTVGSWAWLPGEDARVHWRPQTYWAPGTAVRVDARLYGLDIGGGAYGAHDMSVDFTIGRSQIVTAHAPSHRMQVVRDGATIMDIPVSYGEGNEDRNVTRSGIHVVSEKHEDFLMSNPPYYENVRERWAVRISNNGEFIHANPATIGVQGASNVTNGCINLSLADAEAYFATAIYGDPVEVTGTRIGLSAADGAFYDWTVDWPTWLSMSALA